MARSPMLVPFLRDRGLVLRPLERRDQASMAAILAEPGVAQWWGTKSPEEAAADLYDDNSTALAIEVEGELAGCLLVAEETEPDYRHASLDLFLDAGHQGHGLGPRAIALVARWLFEARGHHRLTIDPAASNTRAIRAYESVGFRPVGFMRRYERGADGTWHDGLLMDLLAGELR